MYQKNFGMAIGTVMDKPELRTLKNGADMMNIMIRCEDKHKDGTGVQELHLTEYLPPKHGKYLCEDLQKGDIIAAQYKVVSKMEKNAEGKKVPGVYLQLQGYQLLYAANRG